MHKPIPLWLLQKQAVTVNKKGETTLYLVQKGVERLWNRKLVNDAGQIVPFVCHYGTAKPMP
jgi:hypothetical protein